MERNSFTLPAAILGAALIVTGAIATYGFFEVKTLADTISVTGSAEMNIESDVIKWNVQIVHSVDLNGLQQGNEAMQRDLESLRAFLKDQGVEDTSVTVQPYFLETMYDYQRGGMPSGYTLRQTVMVESSDIPKVKAAVEAANALIAKGALITTISVEYYYSKLADLKQQILADAMADAKLRAEKIVASAGGKLGSLRSSSMGVLQVTARNSVEVADYGMYDTSVEEKKVTAVVRGEFGIK